MISRPFLSSIAFRLPFAIGLICVLVICLSAIAIYGLAKARDEMTAYRLDAYSSLAKASLVSRQVSDLVSSAPFLINATSPYRVSAKSRTLVEQADTLLAAVQRQPSGGAVYGEAEERIISLLQAIREQTLLLAANAEAAQQHKAKAATALGEIAVNSDISNKDLRRRLNSIVQLVSTADSLFQLGELRRRYVQETTTVDPIAGPPPLPADILVPYDRVFDAQTQYLLEMYAIRSSVVRLNQVARDLSEATETQSEIVTRTLDANIHSASQSLTRFLTVTAFAALLVMIAAILSIRTVMRVSRGIVDLAKGMNELAKGRKDVGPPEYEGDESELLQLREAFRAFRESVERVTRLRRTAEAAARTIRSTFRSMNEGIALFDPTGKPITMNRRVIQLMGRKGSARKLALHRFVETIPEIDPALLPGEGAPGDLEGAISVRHRDASGKVTEISLSRQPDGGVILLARDITQADRQEAEAAKSQRLDGFMRMTHQVSHEVGNMIGIITGSLGLLERDDRFDDKQRRHIARIRKAADRGRALASSMLSVGSQQPINPRPLDVAAFLRGMTDVLEIAVGPDCSVRLQTDANLPAAQIDPALFEQSILNLCLNASAAMPGGGPITLSSNLSGRFLEISVKDKGVGMSPDVADKAFEPYFTTRSETGGAGLGLAMVYGFMRQSGGDVRIASVQGEGTVVTLSFPVETDRREVLINAPDAAAARH
ncbi:sensor histidine kinase [Roseibium suaedae]|uniref:histidine kinase n=1 Tax=Roseibium suaedae TaxID=735517 RepID=A0A1M7KIF5_9HYPH|nr:PAS domain-containing sensor histidine kinase [Roseibium suaedae]SHM64652.1 Signal transduction histidine kinase [Roseibium suaedae]